MILVIKDKISCKRFLRMVNCSKEVRAMGKKRRNKKDDVSVVSILVGLGATYFVAMGAIDLNTALRNAVCGMYDSYLAVNEGAGIFPLLFCLCIGVTCGVTFFFDKIFQGLKPIFRKKFDFDVCKKILKEKLSEFKEDVTVKYKKIVKVCCIVTAVSAVLALGTICSRYILTEDYGIKEYNFLNQQVEEYGRNDIESVTYKCWKSRSGKGLISYGYQMMIKTNDQEDFSFIDGEFSKGEENHKLTLSCMAQMKECRRKR